jgi:CheY-like chemotaxis protein
MALRNPSYHSSPARPIEILLVEDNLADVRLAQEALKEVRASHHLTVARDGAAAEALLSEPAPNAEAARPDLILLDLNLPRKDGRELLEMIKSDPRLRRIPVIILTTSCAHDDVVAAYDLNANAFVRKPIGVDSFIELVRAIDAFWLRSAVLPPPD